MRLLVTVGAQMPFDRLVRAVDRWAAEHPGHSVTAQIGETAIQVDHIHAVAFLEPADFDRAYDEADAVIGHAGIGTLFAAMERGKPILVLPREAKRRETRNDHQSATARRFARFPGVLVAMHETEIPSAIDRLLTMSGTRSLGASAQGPLVQRIARFIDE